MLLNVSALTSDCGAPISIFPGSKSPYGLFLKRRLARGYGYPYYVNPIKELLDKIIQKDATNIKYIGFPSDELQISAVRRNPHAINNVAWPCAEARRIYGEHMLKSI